MGINAAFVGLRAGFQLLVLYFCARLLGPEGYASVSFGMATVAVLQIFLDGGLSSVVATSPGLSHEIRRALHWWGVLVAVLASVILAAVFKFFKLIGEGGANKESLIFIIFYLIVFSFAAHRKSNAEAVGQVIRVSAIETVCVIFGNSVALIGVYFYKLPEYYFLGLLFSGVMQLLLVSFFLKDGWLSYGKIDIEGSVKYVKKGLSLIVASLIGNGSSQADIFLGKLFLSGDAFGNYALVRDLVSRVNALITPVLSRVFMPRMVHLISMKKNQNLVNGVYSNLIYAFSLSFGLLSLFVAFTDPKILNLFFGGGWNFSVITIGSLGVWGWFRGRAILIGPAIYSAGRYELALYWNIARLVPYVLFIYFGIQWDSAGLACSIAIAASLDVVLQYFFIERKLKFKNFNNLVVVPFIFSLLFPVFFSIIYSVFSPFYGENSAFIWIFMCLLSFFVCLMCGKKFFKA